MTNALVNRIKQRLEARREFVRVVFSNHHALVWRLTDAPSLRALGIKPKRPEPGRSRAVQAPREVIAKPRIPRVIDIPETDIPEIDAAPLEEAEPSFETTQNLIELPTEIEALETVPELEISEPALIEESISQPSKLEPGQAREILERLQSSPSPELIAQSDPLLRSGETTPPEVSPRTIQTEDVKAQASSLNPTEAESIKAAVEPMATAQSEQAQLEQAQSEQESEQISHDQVPETLEPQEITSHSVIQSASDSEIEQIENQTKTENKIEQIIQTKSQPEPTKVSRALEALQSRAAAERQESRSNTIENQQSESRSIQSEKQNSLEQVTQENQVLEPHVESVLNNQSKPELEPRDVSEKETRDMPEIPRAGHEIRATAETQSSELETTSPTVEVETFKLAEPESRDAETTTSAPISRPQDERAQAQESVSPQSRDDTSEKIGSQPESRASQPEFVARELQTEFQEVKLPESESREPESQATRLEAQSTTSVPQEPQEPQEPRETSASPDDANWQRSIPGDPQSGVVEIIRAKPPRDFRPNKNKELEARDTDFKPPSQTKASEADQIDEDKAQSKQALSQRMKSLQQRFGVTEQTRFDPDRNSFAAQVEPKGADGETSAANFQSVADVAQRLARRYSQARESDSNEASSAQPQAQNPGATFVREASAFIQQDSQPIQLQESSRMFLEPLIGFDPRAAKIFVSPQATEFTTSLNADGATVATDVYLNNGFDEQSPQGLGLLAHELTHVGQNLQADFVPPILQSTSSQNDLAGESTETQARIVEARVTNTASLFVPGISLETAAARQTITGRAPSAVISNPSSQVARTSAKSWNGLPAPWEAMPSFAPSTATSNTSSLNAASSSSTASVAPAAEAPSASVQLAETGRGSENPDDAPPGAAGEQPHPPAQDMDLLARQVYEILKRRLSSERRREG